MAANYKKQSVAEVEGLQWDGAELFSISSSQQMCYDDAFSLMMVSNTNNFKGILIRARAISLYFLITHQLCAHIKLAVKHTYSSEPAVK